MFRFEHAGIAKRICSLELQNDLSPLPRQRLRLPEVSFTTTLPSSTRVGGLRVNLQAPPGCAMCLIYIYIRLYCVMSFELEAGVTLSLRPFAKHQRVPPLCTSLVQYAHCQSWALPLGGGICDDHAVADGGQLGLHMCSIVLKRM